MTGTGPTTDPEASTAHEWMTTEEAATYLGLTTSQLTNWRRPGNQGGPPFFRMGHRTIRYSRDDLDTYLDQARKATT